MVHRSARGDAPADEKSAGCRVCGTPCGLGSAGALPCFAPCFQLDELQADEVHQAGDGEEHPGAPEDCEHGQVRFGWTVCAPNLRCRCAACQHYAPGIPRPCCAHRSTTPDYRANTPSTTSPLPERSAAPPLHHRGNMARSEGDGLPREHRPIQCWDACAWGSKGAPLPNPSEALSSTTSAVDAAFPRDTPPCSPPFIATVEASKKGGRDESRPHRGTSAHASHVDRYARAAEHWMDRARGRARLLHCAPKLRADGAARRRSVQEVGRPPAARGNGRSGGQRMGVR